MRNITLSVNIKAAMVVSPLEPGIDTQSPQPTIDYLIIYS